ncbi:hypothetical protein [Streptomyces sp. NPDC047065]|uniref:hypothetical protein n=1 Tax=Streptomyces sp. NPDC047065 TaxID=3154606 RepID=UPI0033E1CA39
MSSSIPRSNRPSAYKPVRKAAQGQENQGEGNGSSGPSASARQLLKFSVPRVPAQLTAFINLRVLHPEHAHLRLGVEATSIYNRLRGHLKVPFTYRAPGGEDQETEPRGGRPRSPTSRSTPPTRATG